MIKRPSSKPGKKKSIDPEPFFTLMEQWPDSWAGSEDDIPIGSALVAEMKPFIVYLCSLGLARSTVRKHLDNCWAIGGEIIRDIVMESVSRSLSPRRLVVDAIALGEAPLIDGATEEDQRGFDATARKLWKFLTIETQG
jgi:hypothetical protein